MDDILGDVDDQSLREELESCKNFLTDTEMENATHRFFNFVLLSFDVPLLNDKINDVFKELICAAKINLAFGFVLKNLEDRMCSYFYVHENKVVIYGEVEICVYTREHYQPEKEFTENG